MMWTRIAAALAVPLLLTGCLLTPGKFVSSLTINADRSFTFAYKGEVIAVDPTSEMQTAGGDEPGPDATAEERKAAADKKVEVAKAKTELETKRKAIAAALAKEDGYKSVSYVGEGKYLIDYEQSGRLDHNFIYPFNTDAEIVIPFIAVELRQGGLVRVKAPAFGKSADKNPASAMGMPSSPDSTDKAEGTFTVTTNAEIVMHNNEDGVQAGPGGAKSLIWQVTPLKKDAPVAVLKMKP